MRKLKHTNVTKKKMSKAWDNRVVSQATKIKMSDSAKKRRWNDDVKAKMRISKIKYMATHAKKFSGTDIENIFEDALKRNKIYYLKQIPIAGVTLVDFYLPKEKIVIECDGDYWHLKPEQQIRDAEKTRIMLAKGYKVYRFLGSEIKLSVDSCLNLINEKN